MIFTPVSGCGVHAASAGIQGYMGSQNDQGVTLIERVQAALIGYLGANDERISRLGEL